MGFQARKETDAVAFAVAPALNDTRKGTAMAQQVVFGTVTLVSGVGTVTGRGVLANAFVDLTLITPGGTVAGIYKVTGIGTSGGFTVTAISGAGATQTTDTSTLQYMVTNPLFHGDQTPQFTSGDYLSPIANLLTVTAATAVDLPTSITLANQIRQVLNQMMADSVAHLVADTTNPVSAAVAVDLPSVETLLNACKTSFNAHLTQANVHINNDTNNNVATANATDLPSSEALANALKTAINAHLGSAPAGESVTLLNP